MLILKIFFGIILLLAICIEIYIGYRVIIKGDEPDL